MLVGAGISGGLLLIVCTTIGVVLVEVGEKLRANKLKKGTKP